MIGPARALEICTLTYVLKSQSEFIISCNGSCWISESTNPVLAQHNTMKLDVDKTCCGIMISITIRQGPRAFLKVLPVHRQLVIGIYALLQGPTYGNLLQINIAINLVVKAHGWLQNMAYHRNFRPQYQDEGVSTHTSSILIARGWPS